MLVCITAPPDEQTAIEIAERFRRDGFCPFGANGVHMGFVRSVNQGEGGFLIVVEINEPELEKYFNGMKGGKRSEPEP